MKLLYSLFIILPLYGHTANLDNIHTDTDFYLRQKEQLNSKQQEQKILEKTDQELPQNIVFDGKSYLVDDNEENLSRAIFIAINVQQWDLLRVLINKYAMHSEHDKSILLFAQANLNRSEKKYKLAIKQYQQILEVQPEFLRARLDLATTLFEDQQNKESRIEFTGLQLGEQYPVVQKNIDLYLKAIDTRQEWQNYLSLGMVYNSNINQGSGKSSLGGFAKGSKPESAKGLNYIFATSKNWPVKNNHGVRLRISGNGNFYQNNRQYNDATYSVTFGYLFKNADTEVSVSPVLEWVTNNNNKIYDTLGIRTQLQYFLNPRTQLSIEHESKKYNYVDRYKHLDGGENTINTSLSYYASNRFLLFSGLDFGKKNAKFDDDKSKNNGFRLGLVYARDDFETIALFAWKQKRYQKANLWYLIDEPRKDIERNYTLLFNLNKFKFYDIIPSVRYRHMSRKSNIDWFYSYRANEFSFSLQKTF